MYIIIFPRDSDMRMVADENLNRVIRTLGESNVTRIQVCTALSVHWHTRKPILKQYNSKLNTQPNLSAYFTDKEQDELVMKYT